MESEFEPRNALKAALQQDRRGIRVTRKLPSCTTNGENTVSDRDRTVFLGCEFKCFMPQFNSDFVSVDHDDLLELHGLKPNIKVVSFNGQQFVYKFMIKKDFQNTFETEVRNYRRLAGVPGVPVLRAVVQKGGLIQGILISYIEGPDLWQAVCDRVFKDESALLDITIKIIQLAASLEKLNFYHEDLKCSNIVWNPSNGDIYFIDLAGGLTAGMYREERSTYLTFNGPDPCDALFTLGRTLWELWTGQSPWKNDPLGEVVNETARKIIKECEEGIVGSITELSRKFVPSRSVVDDNISVEEGV